MNKKHFENIDAIRFIAFLIVFCSHAFFTGNELPGSSFSNHFKIGILGVDCFFVLSSFLITWIILEEYQLNKRFNITNFWIRRCLRIWPLYFLIVMLGFTTVLISNDVFNNATEPLPPWYHFTFFTLNFYCANHGIFFLFFLTVLWSVAVEVQFYLFWALVLNFLKKYLLFISFSLVFVSLLFRWVHLNDNNSLAFHTFSALSNFATGAIIAHIAFNKNRIFNFLIRLSKKTIAFFYLLFIFNIVFYPQIYSTPVLIVFERLIFACFFGFMVFEQCFCKNSLLKLGRARLLSYLGIISFGLYCYHGLVITFVGKFIEANKLNNTYPEVFLINPLVMLLITVILAALSYELFEKKILKLKDRFYSI